MRMTIAKKLYFTFGLIVVSMIVIGTISWQSSSKAETGISSVGNMLHATKVSDAATADMLRIRMRAKDFLITNNEADIQSYNEWKRDFAQQIASAREVITNPERLELIDEMNALFTDYDAAFTEVVGVIAERNGIIADTLNIYGPRTVDSLKVYLYARIEAGDVERVALATPALNDAFEARLYAYKYLRTSDSNDLDRVNREVAELQQRLDTLAEAETDADRKASLAAIAQDANTYATGFRRLDHLVQTRNELVRDRMDKIGPQISALGEEIVDLIGRDSAETEEQVSTALRATSKLIMGTVVVAIIASMGLAFLISRSITGPLALFMGHFKTIAEGDFSKQFKTNSTGEVGDLANALNALVAKVASMISQVQQAASDVAAAATEIAASGDEMSHGLNEQTAQVTQISAAIEEMSASVNEVARKSADATRGAKESGNAASEGGKIVSSTIDGMQGIHDAVNASSESVIELGKRGEQIGEIISVINDIAEQTNLLALNAAIEAARAGEHGRGFAVVADEVRKLADRTTEATEEISGSITAIQAETDQAVSRMKTGTEQVVVGMARATEAGKSLNQIVVSANDVTGMIQSIAAAAEQQSAASSDIARNVASINTVSTQTAAGARESAMAAAELSNKAEQLKRLADQFKVA